MENMMTITSINGVAVSTEISKINVNEIISGLNTYCLAYGEIFETMVINKNFTINIGGADYVFVFVRTKGADGKWAYKIVVNYDCNLIYSETLDFGTMSGYNRTKAIVAAQKAIVAVYDMAVAKTMENAYDKYVDSVVDSLAGDEGDMAENLRGFAENLDVDFDEYWFVENMIGVDENDPMYETYANMVDVDVLMEKIRKTADDCEWEKLMEDSEKLGDIVAEHQVVFDGLVADLKKIAPNYDALTYGIDYLRAGAIIRKMADLGEDLLTALGDYTNCEMVEDDGYWFDTEDFEKWACGYCGKYISDIEDFAENAIYMATDEDRIAPISEDEYNLIIENFEWENGKIEDYAKKNDMDSAYVAVNILLDYLDEIGVVVEDRCNWANRVLDAYFTERYHESENAVEEMPF
jgi:hypothetical protein